jgi:hypothetical protein
VAKVGVRYDAKVSAQHALIDNFRRVFFQPTFTFSIMPTLRVPLGAIDNNIVRRQPVTPFARGYIEKGAANGQSGRSIGRELGISESTVRNTLLLNPLRIDGVTQPRSGRPPITCPRSIRRLLRLV